MDMVVLMSSQSCQEKESSKGFHGGAHHGDGCITRLRCEKKEEEEMARPRATRGGVPRKFNLQRFAAIINLRFSAAASEMKKARPFFYYCSDHHEDCCCRCLDVVASRGLLCTTPAGSFDSTYVYNKSLIDNRGAARTSGA
jgi:hypothetical protein